MTTISGEEDIVLLVTKTVLQPGQTIIDGLTHEVLHHPTTGVHLLQSSMLEVLKAPRHLQQLADQLGRDPTTDHVMTDLAMTDHVTTEGPLHPQLHVRTSTLMSRLTMMPGHHLVQRREMVTIVTDRATEIEIHPREIDEMIHRPTTADHLAMDTDEMTDTTTVETTVYMIEDMSAEMIDEMIEYDEAHIKAVQVVIGVGDRTIKDLVGHAVEALVDAIDEISTVTRNFTGDRIALLSLVHGVDSERASKRRADHDTFYLSA